MNNAIETLLRTLADALTLVVERLPYAVLALLTFAVFLLVAWVSRAAVRTAASRARLDGSLTGLLARLVSALVTVVGVFVAAVVLFPSFRPGDLVAGLGITTVAIGFAFKDILQNYFAGVLILWRRPFVVGDQIRSMDYEGTVEDINIRSTRLRTYDGERAVLPNGDVYTHPVLVRTAFQQRRSRFRIGIGYRDSIDAARDVIADVLRRVPDVLPEPNFEIYLSELADSAVLFDVYVWTKPEQSVVLRARDSVLRGIKLALDQAGIDMPYPHQVVLLPSAGVDRRNGDGDRAD